jgi:hypothetical protein
MNLIQAELDRIANNWNMHVIRPQKNASIPSGKPDVMFFVPEIFGGHNFGKRIHQKDVKVCKELLAHQRKYAQRNLMSWFVWFYLTMIPLQTLKKH